MSEATQDIHDKKARIVQESVVELLQRFGPDGMTAAAVAEGAIKAAAVVLMADRGASTEDVAQILEDFAAALRANGPDELTRH